MKSARHPLFPQQKHESILAFAHALECFHSDSHIITDSWVPWSGKSLVHEKVASQRFESFIWFKLSAQTKNSARSVNKCSFCGTANKTGNSLWWIELISFTDQKCGWFALLLQRNLIFLLFRLPKHFYSLHCSIDWLRNFKSEIIRKNKTAHGRQLFPRIRKESERTAYNDLTHCQTISAWEWNICLLERTIPSRSRRTER